MIRALADIADSPAGLLLVPGESGGLELAARWQWPTADVPAVAIDPATVRRIEADGLILDLDSLRSSHDPAPNLPDWAMADPRLAAVASLLQERVPFAQVACVHLVGVVSGLVTRVPAGLGVQEAVFVMFPCGRVQLWK